MGLKIEVLYYINPLCLGLQSPQTLVCVWVLPEADPEERRGAQVVYLGGDPRKHGQGAGT